MTARGVKQSEDSYRSAVSEESEESARWLGFKFSQRHLALFYRTREPKYVRKYVPGHLHEALLIKLRFVARASTLREIGFVKSNSLKAMKGKYAGTYSIRLTPSYRILFSWDKSLGANGIKLIHRRKQ